MGNNKDAMVDIETLGTIAGKVVLSIGYLEFDPRGEDDFFSLLNNGRNHIYQLDIDEQLALGYEVDPDTKEWWSKQSQEAQDRVFKTPANSTLANALTKLQGLLDNVNDIWTYGYMDVAMLNYMSKRETDKELFFYRKYNDLRTVAKLMEFKWDDKPAGMVAHDPLHDCVFQALAVQKLMRD
jgi:hypothetical protein